MASGYEQIIWNYLKNKIGNEYGVAGLMGNLQAESGLYPDRLQGDIPYSSKSREYTAKVDSGVISEYDFVNNGPGGGGYGLAQWTYKPRKQALYNMYKTGFSSIGAIDLALEYLWFELQTSYSGVLKVLQTATSVREASDKVLHDFENPAVQTEAVELSRASMGQEWFRQFNGTGGDVDFDTNTLAHARAIAWAVSIANDDTHGYDQGNRWGPDYDCSSLLISAYEEAGVPVKTNGAGNTRDMIPAFIKSGFELLPWSKAMEVLPGDVLWRTGHVAMFIGGTDIVSAHANELGTALGGQTGDQTTNEINVSPYAESGNWTYILRLPGYGLYKKTNKFKLLMFAIATDRF